jgi:hypothetical protein
MTMEIGHTMLIKLLHLAVLFSIVLSYYEKAVDPARKPSAWARPRR